MVSKKNKINKEECKLQRTHIECHVAGLHALCMRSLLLYIYWFVKILLMVSRGTYLNLNILLIAP